MPRRAKKIIGQTETDIKTKYCTNPELSDQFVSDLMNVTGLEIDDEGYVVDAEDDPIAPTYISVKGKPLRYVKNGILHSKDITFDPYNSLAVLEGMFNQYLEENHPEVLSAQICAAKEGQIPKSDTYGYITILYGNGASIKTDNHWKDTTKYLEAFMRLESMTDPIIHETMSPYDIYEDKFFKENPNGVYGK